MAEQRQALHAYLSADAHQAWVTFSEENGVSLTGLLEALGLEMEAELEDTESWDLRQEWVRAGRKIDAQRRRRQGVNKR
jgi:hypothetical protein